MLTGNKGKVMKKFLAKRRTLLFHGFPWILVLVASGVTYYEIVDLGFTMLSVFLMSLFMSADYIFDITYKGDKNVVETTHLDRSEK